MTFKGWEFIHAQYAQVVSAAIEDTFNKNIVLLDAIENEIATAGQVAIVAVHVGDRGKQGTQRRKIFQLICGI